MSQFTKYSTGKINNNIITLLKRGERIKQPNLSVIVLVALHYFVFSNCKQFNRILGIKGFKMVSLESRNDSFKSKFYSF